MDTVRAFNARSTNMGITSCIVPPSGRIALITSCKVAFPCLLCGRVEIEATFPKRRPGEPSSQEYCSPFVGQAKITTAFPQEIRDGN
jgi:hypothetical protein